MKTKNEIVSLTTVKVESLEGMTLNERLEKLTSKEMRFTVAGTEGCEWMDYMGCEFMCDGVNIYYCPKDEPRPSCPCHIECGMECYEDLCVTYFPCGVDCAIEACYDNCYMHDCNTMT